MDHEYRVMVNAGGIAHLMRSVRVRRALVRHRQRAQCPSDQNDWYADNDLSSPMILEPIVRERPRPPCNDGAKRQHNQEPNGGHHTMSNNQLLKRLQRNPLPLLRVLVARLPR